MVGVIGVIGLVVVGLVGWSVCRGLGRARCERGKRGQGKEGEGL